MGHKIFVSYKYRDSNVKKITNNYWADDTVRDYVDQLQQYFDNGDDIYKGEEDGEDLSNLPDETIWKQLKDRIYDSTLTIVMISPGMKTQQNERDQWIPWEISYSLKEVSRKNKAGNDVTSKSNAILALIIPDRDGSYSYYTENRRCCPSGCRVLKTDRLFTILKNVRYSWGISRILNQNNVNSEFVNRRPKNLRSPGYIFYFSVAILSFKEILNRLFQIQSLRRYQTQKRIGAYFQRLL